MTKVIRDDIDGLQWEAQAYPDPHGLHPDTTDKCITSGPIYIRCTPASHPRGVYYMGIVYTPWLDTGEKDIEKVTQQLKTYGSDYYEFIQAFGPRNSNRKYKKPDQ